jgi:hypothetical protein
MLTLYLHVRNSLSLPFIILSHSLPRLQLIEYYEINCLQ